MSWINRIADSMVVSELKARIGADTAVSVRGVVGSSTVLLAAGLVKKAAGPVLIVTPHLDDADEASDELEGLGIDVARLPVMELVPGETSVNLELLAERLSLIRTLADGAKPQVITASIQSLMQAAPDTARLNDLLKILAPGDRVDLTELIAWLDSTGYRRVPTIETIGEFSVRGGIMDLFPAGGEPTRIDLFGDEIETIHAIDLDTMGSDRKLDSIQLVGATLDQVQTDRGTVPFAEYLPEGTTAILAELLELTEQGRSYFDRVADAGGIFGPPAVFASLQKHCVTVMDVNQFSPGGAPGDLVEMPVRGLPPFDESASKAVEELLELAGECETIVLCQNEGEQRRFIELLAEAEAGERLRSVVQYLHRGLIWDGVEGDRPLALVPYHELLHRYHTRRRIRRIAGGRAVDAFIDLQPGDYVVHRDHGIARYAGLRTLENKGGESEEFLTLEFAKNAKLNVPASKMELVQKYIGAFTGAPELSMLGGKKWKRQKEKVADAVKDLAAEMLRLQALRQSSPGIQYPLDTAWQHEFDAEFPYEETEDQLSAIQATKRDMARQQPMDRLICGDVGFGKTEIAIRAAFKAVEHGKQVAVLVPTTVLAEQHDRTFSQRLADYPFRVEAVSRFRTKGDQKEILEDLKLGKVDVIIGTHRLLSKDVHFADLGLVIIDEEQRFGVEHKQRLLAFRATADVMTLSATPIPRTLHMSMLGLRDISSLTTPPLDRRSIVTEVIPPNKRRIEQILNRELAREGQIFYVHNRVHNIESVADEVQKMAPKAKVIIGHGQMPVRMLERVMLQFIRGDADILVCTTIIESGIDIPRANTMVINDATMFGLSELHQLRGRVGRYKHRAYCYLLLPENKTVSETAMRRLQALEQFSMLGAGFRIALRDLEIRGAGNLLGAEQSGHIAAVGYEMYCQLLEQAVLELKDEVRPSVVDTTIDLQINGSLPKGYIPADGRRLDAYRRISQSDTPEALERIELDLVSAYGKLPQRARMLFGLAGIRVASAGLGIRSIARHEQDIIFRTSKPRELEELMRHAKGTLRIVGAVDAAGMTNIYYRPPAKYLEGDSLITILRRRLAPKSESVGAPVEAAAR